MGWMVPNHPATAAVPRLHRRFCSATLLPLAEQYSCLLQTPGPAARSGIGTVSGAGLGPGALGIPLRLVIDLPLHWLC